MSVRRSEPNRPEPRRCLVVVEGSRTCAQRNDRRQRFKTRTRSPMHRHASVLIAPLFSSVSLVLGTRYVGGSSSLVTTYPQTGVECKNLYDDCGPSTSASLNTAMCCPDGGSALMDFDKVRSSSRCVSARAEEGLGRVWRARRMRRIVAPNHQDTEARLSARTGGRQPG